MPPTPKPRLSDNPLYLLALAVGTIAFALGAVAGLLLYLLGGPDMAIGGVVITLLVYATGYNALLKLRDREGPEP